MANTYISGDYYMICDRCRFKFRRSQMTRTYDGMWVCPKDWEPQHPQEFVRGVDQQIAVPVARPEPEDYFVEAGDITADDL